MKKLIVIIFFSVLILFSLKSQENTLVFMHPTEYNLKLFTYLTDNNIVEINNLRIIGVYHEKEVYDYSKSKAFLEKNDYPFIELKEIKEEILYDKLYEKNNCTNTFNELFKNSNGIFFFGGPDLPPSIYGEQMGLLTRMTDPYRHYLEASFLFHLLGGSQNPEFTPLLEENPYYMVYAICLGMQTMNIACGGTMIQDIPSEIYKLNSAEEVLLEDNNQQHRNYNNNLCISSTLFSGNFHEINISYPKLITGEYNANLNPLVYSNHHQAIEKLGANLKIIATSVDGKIIEAIKHNKYRNVLGIQFHPEGTYLHDPEIKYRKTEKDSLISGKQILLNNNSYQFHLEFWKTFSGKLNNFKPEK
ncbi:MAG: gamma-glutamyl-gamma-aminobutyrate hydrolase family protein [Bacteroidales bacterium]|nr:gamma-glutamyl-gamma-aminobutyrate hydrolase family protein [Bacteroidales bacterium]